jgi:hypothetical protein
MGLNTYGLGLPFLVRDTRLVPKDQVDWFNAHDMSKYGIGGRRHRMDINNVANGMTLRLDLHPYLDEHRFVICPAPGGQFRMQVIVKYDADYTELLHWRSVVIPDGVLIEYLYARFAYTIIQWLHSAKFFFNRAKVSPMAEQAKAGRLAMEQTSKKRKRASVSDEATADGRYT